MGVLLDTRPNEQKLREWAFRSIQAVAARLGDLTEPTGDALVKAGRLEEAVKLYEQRIEQLTQAGGEEAKLPAVRRKLLDAHLTLKQFANALPVLRELTKTFPDDTTLLKTLARTLREVKSFPEAFRTYGVLAAKDKQGNYWSERLALLDAMLAEKQFAEVVRLAEEVLTGEAQPPEALKREFEVRRKQAADAVDAVRQERLLEVRRLIVELADESEDVRKAARAKLMATKEEALPRLVEALDAPEARQRKTAVELLRELSGVAFGFKPEARPEENTEALAKWKEWLKTRTPR